MQQDTSVTAIAHVIQLAVAPVFLLSGIGAMLSVMTNRLGRIVDRARVLEAQALDGTNQPGLEEDLHTLSRRAKLAGGAIAWCTVTALLVCALIATLFVAAFLAIDASVAVALLFVAAMSVFFVGLVAFLREILLAYKSLRIGLDRVTPAAGPAKAH